MISDCTTDSRTGKKPSFSITTLGCKVNQYETEALSRGLETAGWQRTDRAPADLVIVNTCTVTARAARQSLQTVRQALRRHPGARVVVTGCDAQIDPRRLAAIPGVHLVVGHADKGRIPDLITDERQSRSEAAAIVVRPLERGLPLSAPPDGVHGGRTRPFLKIQDGCEAYCTYCIVPYTRGPSRSLPVDQALARIADLGRAGYHEVVLTGIHLGRYGRDLAPPQSLAALLGCIDAAAAIGRVRLSSIEPLEFEPQLMSVLAASTRICPHFHIPLQSGDDDILRRMGRPYRAGQVRHLVADLIRIRPRTAIGMDVLVGFPGESREAFAATCRLIEDLPLAYLHVFPFSPRTGTPAAAMPDQVPAALVKARCAVLRRLGRDKRRAFYQRFVGQRFTAQVEGRRDPSSGRLKAVTDNYLPVCLQGSDALMHRLVHLRVDGVDGQGRIRGRLID